MNSTQPKPYPRHRATPGWSLLASGAPEGDGAGVLESPAFDPVHARVSRHTLTISQRAFANSAVLYAADCAALAGSIGLAYAARSVVTGSSFPPVLEWLLLPLWALVATVNGLLPGWGLVAVEHLRQIVCSLLLLFGLILGALFATGLADEVSRLQLGFAGVFALGLVPLARMLARVFLGWHGLYGAPVCVHGTTEGIRQTLERIGEERGLGYVPVGICSDDPEAAGLGLPVLGGLDDAAPKAPVAVLTARGLDPERVSTLAERLMVTHAKVVLLPDLGNTPSLWVETRDVSGLLGLEISQPLFSPLATGLKRFLDVALVAGTAPLWGPLCLAAMYLIRREDGGDPIYRQTRIGRGGRPFTALKLRTMVPDADAFLQRRLAEDPVLRAEWETSFKLRRDPRITRVGAWLRKTSIDELPQLVNVLRGEMALVGPRPLPEYHHRELPDGVRQQRARMRPGVTGMWQVSGRSDASHAGMVRFDPYYVRNWSLWLDAVILVRTIRVVLLGSGAC